MSQSSMDDMELDVTSIDGKFMLRQVDHCSRSSEIRKLNGGGSPDDVASALQSDVAGRRHHKEDTIISSRGGRFRLCSDVDETECIMQLTTAYYRWFTLGILSGLPIEKCLQIHRDEIWCSTKFHRVVYTLASMCCLSNLMGCPSETRPSESSLPREPSGEAKESRAHYRYMCAC